MHPLRIVGPSDSGKTTLVERLVPELAGRVATVKHLKTPVEIDEPGKDTYRHRAAGAVATYGLEDDGSWFATGSERELYDTLRALAEDYEYALVEGYSGEPTLPALVLAGRDHRGDAIATAPRGGAVDLDRVISRMESEPELETPASLVAEARAASPSEPTAATATLSRRVGSPDTVATRSQPTVSAGLTERAGVHAVRVHADPYGDHPHVHAAVVGAAAGAVARAIATVAERLDRDDGTDSETNGG